jgi:hypothetical protein
VPSVRLEVGSSTHGWTHGLGAVGRVPQTQGQDIDDASRKAVEALARYVEGVPEDVGSLDMGVIRRKFALSASALDSRSFLVSELLS